MLKEQFYNEFALKGLIEGGNSDLKCASQQRLGQFPLTSRRVEPTFMNVMPSLPNEQVASTLDFDRRCLIRKYR